MKLRQWFCGFAPPLAHLTSGQYSICQAVARDIEL
jgi:hypothetical protein